MFCALKLYSGVGEVGWSFYFVIASHGVFYYEYNILQNGV